VHRICGHAPVIRLTEPPLAGGCNTSVGSEGSSAKALKTGFRAKVKFLAWEFRTGKGVGQ
jgi:hypothetical protein